jgi:hypothetical protein
MRIARVVVLEPRHTGRASRTDPAPPSAQGPVRHRACPRLAAPCASWPGKHQRGQILGACPLMGLDTAVKVLSTVRDAGEGRAPGQAGYCQPPCNSRPLLVPQARAYKTGQSRRHHAQAGVVREGSFRRYRTRARQSTGCLAQVRCRRWRYRRRVRCRQQFRRFAAMSLGRQPGSVPGVSAAGDGLDVPAAGMVLRM